MEHLFERTDYEIEQYMEDALSQSHEFSEDEKYLVMSEGRPKTMQWLLLVPK